jgi:hypothetical protein
MWVMRVVGVGGRAVAHHVFCIAMSDAPLRVPTGARMRDEWGTIDSRC